jgi:hypothetical protein
VAADIEGERTAVVVNPIANAPAVGSVLAFVGAICMIIITTVSLVRISPGDQLIPAMPEFSLTIALILLTFPVIHDHYLSLLCIPIFFIIWRYRQERRPSTRRWIRLVLILFGLLLALQRYWRVIITTMPSPLLLTSGFCALLLLWLTLLWLVKTSARQISHGSDGQLLPDKL